MAITGSTSEALPIQLTELKQRLEEDNAILRGERVLLTLLMGANDLCMWDCRRPDIQLESFQSHIKNFISETIEYFSIERGAVLDILIAEIPALEGVPQRAKGTLMEPFAVLECPCAYHPVQDYSFIDRINLYNQIIRNIKPQPHADIIITNVLRREKLKDWPINMTSKLYAFHPSKHAHSYFARKLFTEMESV